MIKLTSVLLIAVIFMTGTLPAQTLSNPPKKEALRKEESQTREESPQNLKRVFSTETEKLKNESAAIDLKTMEKERRQVPKKNWSQKDTAIIVVFAIAVAAIVFLVVKYGKDCKRYTPAGCSFGSDDVCTCAEYEEED